MTDRRRDGRASRAVRVFAARLIATRAGSAQSEAAQAAWTAHDFALFAAALDAVYLVYYVLHDEPVFAGLVVLNAAGLAVYAVAVWLARRGAQLAAALLASVTTIAQILVGVLELGWESGLHLYLIAAGVLVFVIFTAKQAPWRWFFILVAGVTFIACQLGVSPGPDRPVSDPELRLMFSVNAVLTALLVFGLSGLSYFRTNQARAEAARSAARAAFLANTDPLTGLHNRRPIVERLDQLCGQGDYAVAIADIDHFKGLNDAFGHQCGDVVLAHIGSILRSRLRVSDAVGRWGGEEFIAVLPGTGLDDARRLMDRLRARISETSLPCGDHEHTITVSVGVADGDASGVWHHVVKRSDDALYDAKVAGRNVVRVRPAERSLFDPHTLETPRAPRVRSVADRDQA